MTVPTEEFDELADHSKLRVLIVDDHDVVHWGFRLMLGNQPWVERCLSSRNGEEAYALAERYKPDVALVDLFIGEESGPEICQQLRERPPRRPAPPASFPRTGAPRTSRAPFAWWASE
jgi:CheY-like chemotaxis protein